jgi:hypothetical protein
VSVLKIICCAIVGIVAAPVVVLLSVCGITLFFFAFVGTVSIHAATGVWLIEPRSFQACIPNRD